MVLKDNETVNVVGGASYITAALVSALSKAISTIYSLGQNLGSAIYRLIHKQHC
jgi:hypothetical protein